MYSKPDAGYRLRQLNLLHSSLDKFNEGQVSLSALIKNIESLLELLESDNSYWRQEVRNHWETLEQVYSFAVSQVEDGIALDVDDVLKQDESRILIRTSVRKILNLTDGWIQHIGEVDHAPHEDL